MVVLIVVGVLNTVNVLMAGITIYAYYADCDPLVTGQVDKADQVTS